LAKKLRVGVVFGGRSGEHEVSLRSATSIINAMDKKKYDVVPIGITKEGRWLTSGEATKLLPGEVMAGKTEDIALFGDPTKRSLVRMGSKGEATGNEKIDVIFPVLHGTFGEDGTIQGLFDMADIPYVGCGVLGSSCGMDKVIMKNLFRQAGIPMGEFTWFLRTAWDKDRKRILNKVAKEIGLPAFVKPANLGSSVGISKAKTKAELERAIDTAAKFDRKILVEKAINAREIEVSVLGNDEPVASLPGEIVPGEDFYSYSDKYVTDAAKLEIPAKLSKKLATEIQKLAVKAFQAIDGSGLSRVDFFLERDTDRILINEINTLPGFTSISMYPKLWEVSGIPYSELIDRLIALALERHKEKARSQFKI